MTILTHQDRRREVEALAYRARSFPHMSAVEDLADLAPHLTPAARDAAVADLIDGLTLRDAAVAACAAEPHTVAEVLAGRVIPRVAIRAAGTVYPFLLSAARVRAAIARRDYDALDRLDRDLDGALAELTDVRAGNIGAVDCPDADPDRLEELAEEKVTAALGDFSARAQRKLEQRLEQFTVLAWRYADSARLRLTGGAL